MTASTSTPTAAPFALLEKSARANPSRALAVLKDFLTGFGRAPADLAHAARGLPQGKALSNLAESSRSLTDAQAVGQGAGLGAMGGAAGVGLSQGLKALLGRGEEVEKVASTPFAALEKSAFPTGPAWSGNQGAPASTNVRAPRQPAIPPDSRFSMPDASGAFSGAMQGAQHGATQGAQQAMQNMAGRASNNVLQGHKNTAAGVGKAVGHAVSTPFRGLWGGASGAVKGMWNHGPGSPGVLAGAATGFQNQMDSVAAGGRRALGQAAKGVGQTALGAGQAVMTPLAGAVGGIGGAATGAYGGAMAGGFPKAASFTAFAALEKEATQIGTGNQTALPGGVAAARTRPAPTQPIAVGTGSRTVAPGQDVNVHTGTPDLTDQFRKYHGGRFDPKSSMDRGKLQQMQEVFKEHGKLSPSLVYGRQYGTKSASITAFAALGDGMEKGATTGLRGLSGLASRGAASGAQRLGASAHKARVALKGKADEAASSAYDTALSARKGQRGMAGRGIAEESARRAGTGVLDSGKHVGRARATGADWLNQAANKINVSRGLQAGINYGVPTVAGTGALYGANRLGHGSGRKSGLSDGYDVGSELALSAVPDSPGYLGGLMQAIMGGNPADAAAIRNMLDQGKSDVMQTILRGRA